MKTTNLSNGLVEIAVENKDNALHRIGSDSYIKGGKTTVRAADADKWEECPMPPYSAEEYEKTVVDLIRERYSANDEFAIQRKIIDAIVNDPMTVEDDTEPAALTEFREYQAFVNECKVSARTTLSDTKT